MPDCCEHQQWPTRLPFDNGPICELSIYCCDGRFGAHHEAYTQRLGWDHHDRLVVPGGSACLVRNHPTIAGLREEITVQLEFLLTAHAVEHVALLAHDDCAFYQQALGIPKEKLRETQFSDLAKAMRLVQALKPSVSIVAAVAAVNKAGDGVDFLEVPAVDSAVASPKARSATRTM